MNKLFLIGAYFFSIIITCTAAYYYTVDLVLPDIQYDNQVEFDLAYLNVDEKLLIAFKERDAQILEVQSIEVPASKVLNHISLHVPYEYSPLFYLSFGEYSHVTFALSNLSINGSLVDYKKLEQVCKSIGYVTSENNGVIYAQPLETGQIGSLNLYDVSDSFVNFDQAELNKNLAEDSKLRSIYWLFLLLASSVFYKLFLLRFFNKLNVRSRFAWGVSLYIFAIGFAIFISYGDLSALKLEEILFIFKNNLFMAVVPVCLLVQSLCIRRKFFCWVVIMISTLLYFLVGIDHFANVVFGSRFFFETTSKFAGSILDGLPFLISYIMSYSGCYYLLSGLILLVLFSFCFNFINISVPRKYAAFCAVPIIVSIGLLFCGNYNEYSKFYNTFQINIKGLFTEGDYKRSYANYNVYSYDDLRYEKLKGLNQKKNVILVLVESLACDMTFLCGNQNNFSQYTQQLAKDNVWFPNYYSNNFHTNGAIFTITTGLPLVNGPNGEDAYYNKELYTNDLVNKFRQEGYTVAYYTPANLVLNKKRQLEVSNYSYISSVNDSYYDGMEKTGVFSSVYDEKMFDKIISDIRTDPNPKFYILTTVSTHTPYITPWGSRNIELSFKYTDYTLKQFLQKLKEQNYFDSGIVIVTGDHKGWGNNSQKHEDTYNMELHRVPLILINGKDHGVIIDDVSFSHSSLGCMIEYMMLANYDKNMFQINPLTDRGMNETILHYDSDSVNSVIVKKGSQEDQILLDGDQTRFLGSNVFAEEEQDKILGFLSWIRQ